MTAITLNLSPELEQQLQLEAAKAGIEPQLYIINTLQKDLQPNTALEKVANVNLL